MEWLDEFRLSETQREDEEVCSINIDPCLCLAKKLKTFFSYPKCMSQDLDGLMDWWNTVEREFVLPC